MVATALLGQFEKEIRLVSLKREWNIIMYSIEKFCGCCKINVVTWSKVVAFQGLMWGPIYVFFGILYFTPKDSIFAEVYLQFSMQNETSELIYDSFKKEWSKKKSNQKKSKCSTYVVVRLSDVSSLYCKKPLKMQF